MNTDPALRLRPRWRSVAAMGVLAVLLVALGVGMLATPGDVGQTAGGLVVLAIACGLLLLSVWHRLQPEPPLQINKQGIRLEMGAGLVGLRLLIEWAQVERLTVSDRNLIVRLRRPERFARAQSALNRWHLFAMRVAVGQPLTVSLRPYPVSREEVDRHLRRVADGVRIDP